MGRRFSIDVRCNRLILKIVSTYITPLIEYGSIVWDQERSGSNKRLEKYLHNATRFTLQTPLRTDDRNYVDFERRLELCKLLTYEERREIASAIFAIKIYKRTVDTKHDFVRELRYDGALQVRVPPIFTIRRTLS